MDPTWPPVDGITDNEQRWAVLDPTTPHPMTGFTLDCFA
jgi:hypothetical protein